MMPDYRLNRDFVRGAAGTDAERDVVAGSDVQNYFVNKYMYVGSRVSI